MTSPTDKSKRIPRRNGQKPASKPAPKPRAQRPGLRLRQIAADVLGSVLAGSTFEPLSADRLPDERDRALANRLITTSLRRHHHLSAILKSALDRGVPPRSGIFEAAVRLALTELLFLEGDADHAAIFLAVEVVRSDKRARRFDKLANGVLRQAQRDREKWSHLPVEDLLSPSLAALVGKAYGAEAVARFGHALLQGAALDLTATVDVNELAERVGGHVISKTSVRVLDRDRKVSALDGFAEGAFLVQDVAATLPARLIDLPKGARVLDLCAAPGGKTAQLVLGGYTVTAVDIDERRMTRVSDNLSRLNLTANLVVADALTYASDEPFDAILIDAPCSATGTFRRHPEVLLNRSEKDIADLVSLQRAIIAHALTLLKDGGQLVFCTCSIDPREGEDQATHLLNTHASLELSPIDPDAFSDLPGCVTPAGTIRTSPALTVASLSQHSELAVDIGRSGMDGFFAARFKKVSIA